MSKQIWFGGIYFKEEGDYEIILKALNHYKKRLQTIANSPELKDAAAMFASVLQQEARKTVPKIEEVVKKIKECLTGSQPLDSLIDDIPFFQKALSCYESDIKKAQDTGHDYFLNLVGNMKMAKEILPSIKTASKRINQFSE